MSRTAEHWADELAEAYLYFSGRTLRYDSALRTIYVKIHRRRYSAHQRAIHDFGMHGQGVYRPDVGRKSRPKPRHWVASRRSDSQYHGDNYGDNF